MTTYKEHKIKEKTSLIGKVHFEVWEYECISGKPPIEVDSKKLFTGSILECKAYLELLKTGEL